MTLHELQSRFAASLASTLGADGRIGVYRNTVRASCRNALAASYPVVRALVGAAFFDAAVDAYAVAHPSCSGDLNVFGNRLADFLATYAHAASLPYLPDVARLEWAIDEASRAADPAATPTDVVAALAAVASEQLGLQRFRLDASIRLIASRFPVADIWRMHQPGAGQDVDLGASDDYLIVRRSGGTVALERVAAEEFAWLRALQQGSDLANAVERALAIDDGFDLAHALHARIGDGTLVALTAI